ncbi:sulfotransferase family protein [Tindallia californiensis]|uniref:Sulfotransferase family protein n=1 Tax=Tindallia californiensis TaxID=159292 RepID=A0A1H3PCT0_9FIRM|nr:sulfotransferase [Tindallia californiensis]SDY98871.1 Sulfotransferase family protein [Tindallia californiensis]
MILKSKSVEPVESPIFVFAATWRTGSTLVQRVINASEEVFIWGEPSFLSDLYRMTNKLEGYLDKVNFNQDVAIRKKVGGWIPVVSPSPSKARDAVKAFLLELYSDETKEKFGVERWGFKEVRNDAINNILLLKKVFPESKFIFLIRDPYDVYSSLKGKKFHKNFSSPFEPIKVWEKNVREYLATKKDINRSCILIKYEDFIKTSEDNSALLESVARHINVPISSKMYEELGEKVDSTSVDGLTEKEIDEIESICGELCGVFGYVKPNARR